MHESVDAYPTELKQSKQNHIFNVYKVHYPHSIIQ